MAIYSPNFFSSNIDRPTPSDCPYNFIGPGFGGVGGFKAAI